MFCKKFLKRVLKNFGNFTGKRLFRVSFGEYLITVASEGHGFLFHCTPRPDQGYFITNKSSERSNTMQLQDFKLPLSSRLN